MPDVALYHPPEGAPVVLGTGDTVPESFWGMFRALAYEAGLELYDADDAGGLVFQDPPGGGAGVRYWRADPAVRRFREVNFTPGGGLNLGDWSWAAPTAYHGGTALGPPSGSVVMWPQTTAPSGWLLCDGAAVSRTTYARLFALFGTTFGIGDGATTFNLPDLQDRFVKGRSGDLIGDTGGSVHQTVNVNDPGHGHLVADPGHAHPLAAPIAVGPGPGAAQMPGATGLAMTGITVPGPDLTGITAGVADGRPPYLVLAFIIKD